MRAGGNMLEPTPNSPPSPNAPPPELVRAAQMNPNDGDFPGAPAGGGAGTPGSFDVGDGNFKKGRFKPIAVIVGLVAARAALFPLLDVGGAEGLRRPALNEKRFRSVRTTRNRRSGRKATACGSAWGRLNNRLGEDPEGVVRRLPRSGRTAVQPCLASSTIRLAGGQTKDLLSCAQMIGPVPCRWPAIVSARRAR
jgi:hypothetical protein